jgi:hypothetical protein
VKWNIIENPDINLCNYSHLIFDRRQNTLWRKESLEKTVLEKKWISSYRRLKLDPSFSPCININSKDESP